MRAASACVAMAGAGDAVTKGATLAAGAVTEPTGAGSTGAGRSAAGVAAMDGAPIAGLAAGNAVVSAFTPKAPARRRVSACPGTAVAMEAPIVTVASQATATPNQPRPLGRRAVASWAAFANAIGNATSGSNGRTGGDPRAALGQAGRADPTTTGAGPCPQTGGPPGATQSRWAIRPRAPEPEASLLDRARPFGRAS